MLLAIFQREKDRVFAPRLHDHRHAERLAEVAVVGGLVGGRQIQLVFRMAVIPPDDLVLPLRLLVQPRETVFDVLDRRAGKNKLDRGGAVGFDSFGEVDGHDIRLRGFAVFVIAEEDAAHFGRLRTLQRRDRVIVHRAQNGTQDAHGHARPAGLPGEVFVLGLLDAIGRAATVFRRDRFFAGRIRRAVDGRFAARGYDRSGRRGRRGQPGTHRGRFGPARRGLQFQTIELAVLAAAGVRARMISAVVFVHLGSPFSNEAAQEQCVSPAASDRSACPSGIFRRSAA